MKEFGSDEDEGKVIERHKVPFYIKWCMICNYECSTNWHEGEDHRDLKTDHMYIACMWSYWCRVRGWVDGEPQNHNACLSLTFHFLVWLVFIPLVLVWFIADVICEFLIIQPIRKI